MPDENELRECPYCKEDIKASAIKCKHCSSAVAPEVPSHEGTCPYCKEEIKTDAIKCKHCISILEANLNSVEVRPNSDCGCGCGSPQTAQMAMAAPSGGVGASSDCYTNCKDANDCSTRACKWKCFERCYPATSGLSDSAVLGNVAYDMMVPPFQNDGGTGSLTCKDYWYWICTGTPGNMKCKKHKGKICTEDLNMHHF